MGRWGVSIAIAILTACAGMEWKNPGGGGRKVVTKGKDLGENRPAAGR